MRKIIASIVKYWKLFINLFKKSEMNHIKKFQLFVDDENQKYNAGKSMQIPKDNTIFLLHLSEKLYDKISSLETDITSLNERIKNLENIQNGSH